MQILDKSACKAVLLTAVLLVTGYGEGFESPTRVPAAMSEKMLMSPLTAVTSAGARTIAVGQRGHIAVSEDGGRSWRQAMVPVSNDLVAVSFADGKNGWAVGHGGVVLHSRDGGDSWELQLDGQQTSQLVLDYYADPQRGGAVENAQLFIDRENNLLSYGGTQALMAVHFLDASNGFVVGLFNRILRTSDGGKTWEPWEHRIENPDELHFYSMSADSQALYITGEQGMVWRMGKGEQHFAAIPTGYTGTLFGSVSNGRVLVAFGMRGSVFRSIDAGAHWQQAQSGTSAGITSGMFLQGDELLLGSLSGEMVLSTDGGASFDGVNLKRTMPLFGLLARPDGQLTLVGAAGVRHEELSGIAQQTVGKSAALNVAAERISALQGVNDGRDR
ncbi:WD40/YVTN/BNR-like repeat-containing protein [Pseudomonas jinjuensis]|uniref:Photosynthesis system II assembly factor Ycf48/Hcf136-like domain-containing protein n=1 Tax=Pseudomonas jinjuensis TaxID=198616 RepID=A0A1H0EHQ2_9PSED|nr:YCF48-related protein [Pseudomonas jinjuensis]SDN82017.1 Uncharacterized protein SAMN05216193_105182 [Pseudomonas jinjuensis]